MYVGTTLWQSAYRFPVENALFMEDAESYVAGTEGDPRAIAIRQAHLNREPTATHVVFSRQSESK